MRLVNLPTDMLRTFVSVIDLGSYTKAGATVGRTQPAITLQIRRFRNSPAARSSGGRPGFHADGGRRDAAQLRAADPAPQ